MAEGRTPRYDARRDPANSTYGDAHKARKRAPKVFAGGTQYALDVLLREMRHLPGIDADVWDLIDGVAVRILHAAQTDEPLP